MSHIIRILASVDESDVIEEGRVTLEKFSLLINDVGFSMSR